MMSQTVAHPGGPPIPASRLLTDARSLRTIIGDLRSKLELLQRTEEQPAITATKSKEAFTSTASRDDGRPSTSIESPSTHEVNKAGKELEDDHVEDDHVDDEEQPARDESTSRTSSDESLGTQVKGLAKVRTSSVAIVGGMDGKGLRAADTLVRCGVRKLLLFDEMDASERVEQAKLTWEQEDNPSFELEAYVSSYELNDDSYDHFLDRLMIGGVDDRPIDLIVLPGCERISAETFHLLARASQTVDCPLLYNDNSVISVLEPGGNELHIDDKNTTIAMAALEFLLA